MSLEITRAPEKSDYQGKKNDYYLQEEDDEPNFLKKTHHPSRGCGVVWWDNLVGNKCRIPGKTEGGTEAYRFPCCDDVAEDENNYYYANSIFL